MSNFQAVRTIENKCRRCYTCVRFCPAKAIRVEHGQAVVIPERCIGCGNCVKVCTQNAKEIHSSVDNVEKMLQSERKIVAIVAPSFAGELEDNVTAGQLVAAYKKMGFYKVVEVAFGADLVSLEYKNLYEEGGNHYITSACPAVNYYIQKYHPELISHLTPVVSPMIAVAKAVKAEYGEDVGVVFIGPCIAKKKEARDVEVAGLVDEVMTFRESRILRDRMGVGLEDQIPSSFDPPHPSWGRAFPITGGALRSSDIEADILDYKIEAIDGRENFIDFINEFHKGRAGCKMAEILFCEGCINGPVMTEGGGSYTRKRKVSDYIKQTQRAFNVEEWQFYMKKYSDLNLERPFPPEDVEVKEPTEDEIRKILRSINKPSEADELNCGACGYESCRAMAKAVYEGLAEKEMCFSYTIDELEKTLKELHDSHVQLQTTQQQLIQSEKQASLGQLAAGVAHELNNPLGTILLYADLLLKQIKENARESEDLILIAKEAQRCKTIVSGLLNFSRQREVFCRRVNLNRLLEDTLGLIQTQKKREFMNYHFDLDPSLPPVELDPEQLKQVIVNLVMNAIEVMEERGNITVRSKYLVNPDRVQFSVSDDGPGIPPGNVKKLFTPFFTTKQIGQGTGLGLAISYGIIKMHRGDIRVDTELGKGSTFIITLPRLHNSPASGQLLGGPTTDGSQLVVSYQPRRFNRADKAADKNTQGG